MEKKEENIVKRRLKVLKGVSALGSVSLACHRMGIGRTQFYEYKRAFQEGGFESLKDQPPIPKSFPNETPKDVIAKIIARSIEHPVTCPQKLYHFLNQDLVAMRETTHAHKAIHPRSDYPSFKGS